MIIICFLDVIKYVTNKWEQIQNSFKTKFESFRNQNQLKKGKIIDNLMLRSIILAAKKLNNKNDSDGISIKTKKGNLSLDNDIKKKVIHFYENEDNSRQLSGKKDVKLFSQMVKGNWYKKN